VDYSSERIKIRRIICFLHENWIPCVLGMILGVLISLVLTFKKESWEKLTFVYGGTFFFPVSNAEEAITNIDQYGRGILYSRAFYYSLHEATPSLRLSYDRYTERITWKNIQGRVVTVSFQSRREQEAAIVANAVFELLYQKIQERFGEGQVIVIDQPMMLEKNEMRISFLILVSLGMLVGCVVGIILAYLLKLMIITYQVLIDNQQSVKK